MITATLKRSAIEISRSEGALDSTWRQAVGALSASTLGHAAEWHTAIWQAYRHEPLYLTAEDDEGHRGVLPAFIVRRPLFGTVVASMPFLDTGGPCASSADLAYALVERLMVEARGVSATVVDLRCTQRLNLPVPPMEHKATLTLALPSAADCLWRQLGSSVRNQIRKAERSGLSVEFGGVDKLDEFYAVFSTRMRELGSPVHGRQFFATVFEAFGGRARLALVRKGRAAIGGLIALAFKDVLAAPWASCLSEFLPMCPNMLLYSETIRRGCVEGFRRFDFGRSSRGSGTYRFKRQWGAQEEPLFWYTIPVGGRRTQPTVNAHKAAELAVKVWQRLPLSITRHLGPPLRKYLTQ